MECKARIVYGAKLEREPSFQTERLQSLLHTVFQRLIGVDDGLRQGDRLEVSFDVEIEV